jgi:nucleoside-diphosphate-sugar epimerase
MTCKFSKVLVTGGAGFIGSHIVDKLLSEGLEVTVVDNLSAGQPENFYHNSGKENFRFVEGDIRDTALVKGLVKDVEAVFHEAALISVVSSVKDPLTTHDVNVTGTLNLLKICVDSGVKRFVFASSASIYGEMETPLMREDMIPRPVSPYAVSKLAAENYAKLFYKIYGLETVCLRYFNVYGPRQKHSQYSGVIPIFIERALSNEPPIVYGDGKQTRDFVNVQDVVDANLVASNSKNAVGQVFNIGTGKAISINQLAKIIFRLLGKEDLKPVHSDLRPGETKLGSCADISKTKINLGYEPKITLEEGLLRLSEWYKNHMKQL